MEPRKRIFLDTSALFSGLWSNKDGARMLLKLGEIGMVKLLVSYQVLKEIQNVITKKAPQLLLKTALILDRSNVEIVSSAPSEIRTQCYPLVPQTGDTQIIADAWENQVDFLVTLDKRHFLENKLLLEQAPFPIGTPGDCLAWIRNNL